MFRSTSRAISGRCFFSTNKIDPRSLYEPIFPKPIKPVPTYDLINICFKSYDFQVLERFQAYAYGITEILKLQEIDGWATPCSKIKASTYKARTNSITEEFLFNKYQRNIQLADVPASKLSILIDFLHTNLPIGVQMNVKRHETADDDVRYVPDYDFMDLSKKLDDTEKSLKSMKLPTAKK